MFAMRGEISHRFLAICGLAATLSISTAAQAEDWPEWRGKGRLGVWNDTGILDQFPSGGLDFVWRVPVNEGYGGPAVANGLVFATDFKRTTGNNGIERLLCLDEKSGRVIWTHEWEVDTKGTMGTYANGPRATPTVDEDRVYVLGQMGNLLCIRVTDGSVIWQRDYVKDFGATVPVWGMVGAPLVDGPRLYCLVGGEPNAKAMALDKMTGEEIWRSIGSESEPGYAPPVLVQAGDIRQVIIWHPTGIVSLDPESGKPLWEKPYEVAMGQTIAQPIFDANRLMVSSSSHGSTMLRLSSSAPTAEVVWKGDSKDKDKVDGLHAFNATPFIDGDYVYGVGGKGFLRCVEAKTGKEVWSTAEPSEDARIATAFLVKNGDRYFINNDRGELILAELSPEGYRELSRTKLIEPLNQNARVRREMGAVNWSHPAYANGHIFQRNNKELVRASLLK